MITPGRLNELLGSSWPHGEILSSSAIRIGEDYGFGGAVFLLQVTTRHGPRSLVAKRETVAEAKRVAAAYKTMGHALSGRVPELYGWSDDLTLFEHVNPAVQGDGLDIAPWQVSPMLQLLASLHALPIQDGEDRWIPDHWQERRWEERLRVVRERYPKELDPELHERLVGLHDEIPSAIEVLDSGPTALVHMDSGFDNTMWRPDGTIVVLDWGSARPGPPGYEVAAHLLDDDPDTVLETYRVASSDGDNEMSLQVLTNQVAAGLRIMVRGMVGFAGLPQEPSNRRLLAFRDGVIPRVRRELAWLDRVAR